MPAAPKAAAPRRRTAIRAPLGAALPSPPGTPRKKAAAAGPVSAKSVSAKSASAKSASAKPARARRVREAPAEASRLDQLQKIIVDSLEDDKAEHVVALDLAGRASFADRMVIATGLADRQIAAMATHLEDKLHAAGLKRIQMEGATGSDWLLIDAGDIVIHLFKADAREQYGLERMWAPALDEPAPEPTEAG